MKSNISQADKIIRIAIGLSLGLIGVFSNVLWLGIVAIVILATALINYDPFYAIFGYSSRKYHASPFQAKHKKKNHH